MVHDMNSCDDELVSLISLPSTLSLDIDLKQSNDKLKEELWPPILDSSQRFKMEAINQFLNSTRKSFHESNESIAEIRKTSTPKVRKTGDSAEKKQNNFVDTLTSDHVKDDDGSVRKQICHHLNRIQHQVEADRDVDWILQHSPLASVQKSRSSKTSPTSLDVKFKAARSNLQEYEKKILKQKATIRLLTEQLQEEDFGRKTNISVSGSDLFSEQGTRKSLAMQLSREKQERMKVMKEYSSVQEKFKEVEEERLQLVLTLSDLKSEARTILKAYEEAAMCIPEMQSMLQQSTAQKEQYSEQITKLAKDVEIKDEEISVLKEKLVACEKKCLEKEKETEESQSEVEELRKKYRSLDEKLQSTNKLMVDARESFADMEKSREDLKEKAVHKLKMYRSKCELYEIQMKRDEQEYAVNQLQLSNITLQMKQLEESNLKLKEELKISLEKMKSVEEELQVSTTKCEELQQENTKVSEEVTNLRTERDKMTLKLEETEKLKNEKEELERQILEGKNKISEYQALSNGYNVKILAMEKEIISRNENLKNSATVFQTEDLKRAKEEAGIAERDETNDSEQRHVIATKDFTIALEMITYDIDNLLRLLWQEDENGFVTESSQAKLSVEKQSIVMDVIKKVHSCYSVTKALKERYNGQKTLITRARERIKSQLEIIDDLKKTNSREKVKHLQYASSMETQHKEKEKLVSQLKSEKRKLEHKLSKMSEDLHRCVEALHTVASVEMAKEGGENKITVVDKKEDSCHGRSGDRSAADINRRTKAVQMRAEEVFKSLCSMSPTTRSNLYRFVYESPGKSPMKNDQCLSPGPPFVMNCEESMDNIATFVVVKE